MMPDWPRAFPAAVSERVVHAASQLPPAEFQHAGLVTHSNAHHWPALVVEGETVEIPYRMYNPELPGRTWDALSALDRAIVACMYSRHNDGRVRQAAVGRLMTAPAPFIALYVVQLLGEYVVEIASDVADGLEGKGSGDGSKLLALLSAFARDNSHFITLTRDRARSCWAAYYRRDFPTIRHWQRSLASLTRPLGEVRCQRQMRMFDHA
jgi:hypothetical protein